MPKLKATTKDEAQFIFAAEAVRDMLKSGKIKDEKFNMGNFSIKDDTGCNTIHCIGGWMDTILRPNAERNYNPIDVYDYNLSLKFEKRLDKLFFPSDRKMDKAKPSHAVKAINNFLNDKPDSWRGVKV